MDIEQRMSNRRSHLSVSSFVAVRNGIGTSAVHLRAVSVERIEPLLAARKVRTLVLPKYDDQQRKFTNFHQGLLCFRYRGRGEPNLVECRGGSSSCESDSSISKCFNDVYIGCTVAFFFDRDTSSAFSHPRRLEDAHARRWITKHRQSPTTSCVIYRANERAVRPGSHTHALLY